MGARNATRLRQSRVTIAVPCASSGPCNRRTCIRRDCGCLLHPAYQRGLLRSSPVLVNGDIAPERNRVRQPHIGNYIEIGVKYVTHLAKLRRCAASEADNVSKISKGRHMVTAQTYASPRVRQKVHLRVFALRIAFPIIFHSGHCRHLEQCRFQFGER